VFLGFGTTVNVATVLVTPPTSRSREFHHEILELRVDVQKARGGASRAPQVSGEGYRSAAHMKHHATADRPEPLQICDLWSLARET